MSFFRILLITLFFSTTALALPPSPKPADCPECNFRQTPPPGRCAKDAQTQTLSPQALSALSTASSALTPSPAWNPQIHWLKDLLPEFRKFIRNESLNLQGVDPGQLLEYIWNEVTPALWDARFPDKTKGLHFPPKGKSHLEILVTRKAKIHVKLESLGRGGYHSVFKTIEIDWRHSQPFHLRSIHLPLGGLGKAEIFRIKSLAEAPQNLDLETLRQSDFDEIHGMPVMIQPVYDRDLQKVLSEENPAVIDPLALAQHLIHELLELHQAGFAHGDVTPGNILWSGDKWLLNDFGFYRDLKRDTEWSEFGTPRYQAPEALYKSSLLNPSSDIFSFGVILLEAMGHTPSIQLFNAGKQQKTHDWDSITQSFELTSLSENAQGRRFRLLYPSNYLNWRKELLSDEAQDSLIKIALDAIHPNPTARPTARKIQERLVNIRFLNAPADSAIQANLQPPLALPNSL